MPCTIFRSDYPRWRVRLRNRLWRHCIGFGARHWHVETAIRRADLRNRAHPDDPEVARDVKVWLDSAAMISLREAHWRENFFPALPTRDDLVAPP